MKFKKTFILILTAALIFLTACSSGSGKDTSSAESAKDDKTGTIEFLDKTEEELHDNVVFCKSTDFSCGDGITGSIVGMTFTKSSGNVVDDAATVGNGLVVGGDATARGYNMGYKNAGDSKIRNMNGYLCIYIKYTFNDKLEESAEAAIKEQASKIIAEASAAKDKKKTSTVSESSEAADSKGIYPTVKAKITDDKKSSLALIHFSNEKEAINLHHRYGMLMFKCDYNAKTFNVTINDKTFTVSTSALAKTAASSVASK